MGKSVYAQTYLEVDNMATQRKQTISKISTFGACCAQDIPVVALHYICTAYILLCQTCTALHLCGVTHICYITSVLHHMSTLHVVSHMSIYECCITQK